ncbi:MAG TPA: cation transporter [Cyanobacteria bacterium UBA11149]|nr:cation transporter [Cyanobacteria bacterium UBA11367]HBE57071.1 cation transporter [Cyanobacteria bacterium UBA11366]HBK63450.1 cation transporter [Cyanobacteria bacterium UBA11166]HBR72136.1 cation transporter [Cyanobacteria bacterium UBA11159]HBS72649.1 cation transporter [Cyanobacteria bacterium UBA11153]HBW91739.1 cation transporter [Cyanobacteria bacterium UBA11149]HCA97898.1 cation transporter [Cyanobacteria bacterium UBA9226]
MTQDSPSCTHHSHHINPTSDKIRLLITTLILIGSFAIAEFIVGKISHSLALVAESGHMASDCLGLILALLAAWIARRQNHNYISSENYPIELTTALLNGVVLVVVALWIGGEAIARLESPHIEILSLPMLAIATVGLGVNSINIWLLHKDSHDDLNIRGAFLHIVADTASSIGVILGAIAVWQLHWIWADAVVSLFVATLIIISAIPLIMESIKALFFKSVTDS